MSGELAARPGPRRARRARGVLARRRTARGGVGGGAPDWCTDYYKKPEAPLRTYQQLMLRRSSSTAHRQWTQETGPCQESKRS